MKTNTITHCGRCHARTEYDTDGNGRLVERHRPCICRLDPKATGPRFTAASTAGMDRRCRCGKSLSGRHINTKLCHQCAEREHNRTP